MIESCRTINDSVLFGFGVVGNVIFKFIVNVLLFNFQYDMQHTFYRFDS